VPPEPDQDHQGHRGQDKVLRRAQEPIFILASEWTRFELAYYALVEFTSPVTIDTLRHTRNTGKGVFWEASTGAEIHLALVGHHDRLRHRGDFSRPRSRSAAASPGGDNWKKFAADLSPYIKIIIPYAYGGLGACAFLLRTAHKPDRRALVRRAAQARVPQPHPARHGERRRDRPVVSPPDSEEETVKISAAALGFIAGYSNDFLFNAIERVVAAVLPRVGIESMKRESAAPAPVPLDLPTGGMTLKDLMDRMENAKPEDKELYKRCWVKLRDRL